MLVTKSDIEYSVAPYGVIAVIPEGTEVLPATNLPLDQEKKYWVKNWRGMSEKEESWAANYGFLLSREEIKRK